MNSLAPISISAWIEKPLEIVWKVWIRPVHVKKWNNASPDWHTPFAKNNLKVGGKFNYRMEARDGSFGFDFEGVYQKVETEKLIAYVLPDGREVSILFEKQGNGVLVTETFDPEHENSVELQRQGWQAILDNFKRYAESI